MTTITISLAGQIEKEVIKKKYLETEGKVVRGENLKYQGNWCTMRGYIYISHRRGPGGLIHRCWTCVDPKTLRLKGGSSPIWFTRGEETGLYRLMVQGKEFSQSNDARTLQGVFQDEVSNMQQDNREGL